MAIFKTARKKTQLLNQFFVVSLQLFQSHLQRWITKYQFPKQTVQHV